MTGGRPKKNAAAWGVTAMSRKPSHRLGRPTLVALVGGLTAIAVAGCAPQNRAWIWHTNMRAAFTGEEKAPARWPGRPSCQFTHGGCYYSETAGLIALADSNYILVFNDHRAEGKLRAVFHDRKRELTYRCVRGPVVKMETWGKLPEPKGSARGVFWASDMENMYDIQWAYDLRGRAPPVELMAVPDNPYRIAISDLERIADGLAPLVGPGAGEADKSGKD